MLYIAFLPFLYIIKGNNMVKFRKAVLVIHGFAGGVYDLEYLSTMLELKKKYDVFTFTLPGHTGENIKKITHKDWIKKSEDKVNFLIEHGYKNIYVIGHSMGGVIACYLASKYSEIKKLVLAAPAFKVTGHETGKWKISKVIKEVPKIFEQYGFKLIKDRMTKIPMNFYSEFLVLTDKYKNVPKQITIPTLLIWGKEDKIVPPETGKDLLEKLDTKYKKLVIFSETTHDIFRENKKEEATKYIEKFLKNEKSLFDFPDEV